MESSFLNFLMDHYKNYISRKGNLKKMLRLWDILTDVIGRNTLIYGFCKRYVDRFNGENNSNILSNGEYDLIKYFIPRARLALDIGANKGEWTKLSLGINPDIVIHCFEPDLSEFNYLMANKFPSNIICNNLGCGAKEEEVDFYKADKNGALNSIYKRSGLDYLGLSDWKESGRIKIINIDCYCIKHNISFIDFIKIDVEGHELEVIRGMEDLIRHKQIRVIQFEYGGAYIDARVLLKDIWQTVLKFSSDYKFFKVIKNNLIEVPCYSQIHENFQLQTWAIIRQ